jgi:hypothetical protein
VGVLLTGSVRSSSSSSVTGSPRRRSLARPYQRRTEDRRPSTGAFTDPCPHVAAQNNSEPEVVCGGDRCLMLAARAAPGPTPELGLAGFASSNIPTHLPVASRRGDERSTGFAAPSRRTVQPDRSCPATDASAQPPSSERERKSHDLQPLATAKSKSTDSQGG